MFKKNNHNFSLIRNNKELDQFIAKIKNCINEQTRNAELLPKLLYALGEVYTRLGEWDKAVDLLKDAAAAAQRVGDLKALASAFRMLDRAHESLGRFYKAHCYREKLSQLVVQSDFPL